ncbi:hypothetical protein OGAPHI_002946 [Ogataea philodendri]|uniref:Peptidyl-prolyl cis-trans isomerase n=1 Tax=Ogataea philodendri TaxID=1378263 RepID=A0A9P8P8L7_9ASCO|nr:uncharacterized protein OGAPHI_002946 [Ogataea philodendri]KAH3667297.1 hypothetical protein OGAPHI_002946 [Ogataea philodendri]
MVSILTPNMLIQSLNPHTGLPRGWQIRISKTHGQEYYYNPGKSESVWTPPEGTDQEALDLYLSKNLHKPKKVRARHILVKHRDSRRPSSWKEQNITRSKEEAVDLIKKYKSQIESGEVPFEELAGESSDCSSHAKGGDLGFFGPGEMQPSFEKATFGLQVGELSDVVESDSGIHLIERTG